MNRELLRIAGQKGGQATLAKYGTDYFRKLSKQKVGRKPLPTLNELKKRQQHTAISTNTTSRRGKLPADLNSLKRLWLQKQEGRIHSRNQSVPLIFTKDKSALL